VKNGDDVVADVFFTSGMEKHCMHYFADGYLFFGWNTSFERYFEGLVNALLNLKIEEDKKKQHPKKFIKWYWKTFSANAFIPTFAVGFLIFYCISIRKPLQIPFHAVFHLKNEPQTVKRCIKLSKPNQLSAELSALAWPPYFKTFLLKRTVHLHLTLSIYPVTYFISHQNEILFFWLFFYKQK